MNENFVTPTVADSGGNGLAGGSIGRTEAIGGTIGGACRAATPAAQAISTAPPVRHARFGKPARVAAS
ncbi:MAG: hypothetical protein DMG01_22040 [Acidobacteria bacterium]|nr:MAG: hypothetical protein DMG01_22040 [Acidobacteriota bacterium]